MEMYTQVEYRGEPDVFTRFCHANFQRSVSSGHPGHVERIAPLTISGLLTCTALTRSFATSLRGELESIRGTAGIFPARV